MKKSFKGKNSLLLFAGAVIVGCMTLFNVNFSSNSVSSSDDVSLVEIEKAMAQGGDM